MNANYKEPVAKTATPSKIGQSMLVRWQTAKILLRCTECQKYIYPGHLVWMESPDTYCFRCGSVRQDELKNNHHKLLDRLGVSHG